MTVTLLNRVDFKLTSGLVYCKPCYGHYAQSHDGAITEWIDPVKAHNGMLQDEDIPHGEKKTNKILVASKCTFPFKKCL